MKTVQVERAQLEQWLQAFKKIHDDKHSHWDVDEEISAIEKALEPIAMDVMKSDEADFWRWWKPYQLKDCWRLEFVARDAWMAAKAALKPKEPEQEPWGACVSGRVFVGNLPEYVRVIAEDEGLPIQWLYTTPPQRKPLTDERLDDIYYCVEGWATALETWRQQARAIEAAHGIKE